MSKKVLLDNAYEAWISAIENHDRIEKGFFSLRYQKNFVSSLHNSVELFLKQMMIDSGQHDVLEFKKIDNVDKAKKAYEFFQTEDMNAYFSKLNKEQLKSIYSIEFNKLKGKYNTLTGSKMKKEDSERALDLLQKLRNEETHFYINKSDYLPETDFSTLHNFMIGFYEDIKQKELLPSALWGFSDSMSFYENALMFVRDKFDSFDYVEALKKNPMVHLLKEIMLGEKQAFYAFHAENAYDLMEHIVSYNPTLQDKKDDVFTLLHLMREHQLFKSTVEWEEIGDNLGFSDGRIEFAF